MRSRTLVALTALVVLGAAACSPTDVPERPDGPLVDDDGEATLVTVVSTVPQDAAAVPEAVAARLARTVPVVIGVVFEPEQTECVTEAIVDSVDTEALVELGFDGSIEDEPLDVQAQVFDAFDRCVDPVGYARVAGPILMLAGVQQPVAECVFREIRDRLGFAGMYGYALGNIGATGVNPELADRIDAAYAACDLDPTGLTVPTGPPAPTQPGATTTTAAATTTTIPSTAPGTIPGTPTSSTVSPPVQPPTDPVPSTTRPRPTTTLGAGTTSVTSTATTVRRPTTTTSLGAPTTTAPGG